MVRTKPSAGVVAGHPLDPLSETEVALASEILRTEKRLGPHARFTHVQLEEPAKSDVLGWKPAAGLPRRAAVTLFDSKTGATHVATVDLDSKRVTAWCEYSTKAHPYGQPPITIEEVFKVGDIVKADADWRRAMKRRGLNDEDIELVQVDPFSAGYFDREVEKGRRLVSAVSYWRKDIKDNGYAHPIEGVVALVDLIENRIVHLVDEPDIVPIPKKSRNYDRASIPQTRKDVKPLDVVQKDGPSFTVDGWKVDWQNWSFRVGWTAREGLVLHQIAFRDGARERPIIYRASVTDMIVPYADPTANHFWKCAFDAGEYGLGKLANALELGCDCLGHIHYFDVPVADDYGKPTIMKNALPARGGLRDPLEALRIPQRDVRGAAVTPPRHLVLHHRRKLRLRILLVLLPGRHHSARSQAHRHHPDGGDRTGQAVSVGRHGR
jgi:primary-amine oxidase